MKHLIRYLSLLLCFLLLFVAFSVPVSADSSSALTGLEWSGSVFANIDNYTGSNLDVFFEFNPFNSTTEKEGYSTNGNIAVNSNIYIDILHKYSFSSSTPIIKKGNSVKLTIQGVPYAIKHENSTGSWVYDTEPSNIRFLIFYNDNSMQYVDGVTFSVHNSNNLVSDFSGTFTPKADVKEVEILIYNEIPLGDFNCWLGETDGMQNGFNVYVEQETNEEGLLKGIIGWLQGIKNGISDLFNSIAELPSKIWSFIENGLKSLFVPSEEYITQFKDNMQNLLSEKLGAVYQVLDITFSSWDRIKESDQTNTINIPEVSIDLPEDVVFSFGGYEVDIVPNGFEFIVTIIKSVVGIVCTVLFINGLRKRYEEIMGVEK